MNIYEKLLTVQTKLKAPKSQYNSFGKYSYRNAEDILEVVKPLCKEVGAFLVIKDEVVLIGDRYYVKATAKFIDTAPSGGQIAMLDTTAYAREESEKKGMDGSQITGASSSYARKYALNGLFAIDDTKDSDATNTGDKKPIEEVKPQPKKLTLSDAENMVLKTDAGEILLKNLSIGQLQKLYSSEKHKEYHEAVKLILEFKSNG